MLLFTCIQLRKPLRFLCLNKSIKIMYNINLSTTRVHPNTRRTHHRQQTTLHVSDSLWPVLVWKGISGLKFPCFLFYACLLLDWRWEPVEFRAIPILLRKLPNFPKTSQHGKPFILKRNFIIHKLNSNFMWIYLRVIINHL